MASLSCAYCDKTFSSKISLVRHADQEHRARQLAACDICGQEFSQMGKVKKHISDYHCIVVIPKLQPWEIEQNRKVASTSTTAGGIKRKRTCSTDKNDTCGNDNGEEEKECVKCQICKKSFSSGHLVRHKQFVHGILPSYISPRVKRRRVETSDCSPQRLPVGQLTRVNNVVRAQKQLIDSEFRKEKLGGTSDLRSIRPKRTSSLGVVLGKSWRQVRESNTSTEHHQHGPTLHVRSKSLGPQCPETNETSSRRSTRETNKDVTVMKKVFGLSPQGAILKEENREGKTEVVRRSTREIKKVSSRDDDSLAYNANSRNLDPVNDEMPSGKRVQHHDTSEPLPKGLPNQYTTLNSPVKKKEQCISTPRVSVDMRNAQSAILECTCDICGKVFSRKDTVPKHKLAVHGVDSSNLPQGELPKKSQPSRSNGEMVLESRTSGSAFKARNCSVVLESVDGMIARYKVTATESGCRCEICGKLYADLNRVKRHKRKVHGVRQSDKNKIQNTFDSSSAEFNDCRCDICGKVFSRKDTVPRHKQMVHSLLPKKGSQTQQLFRNDESNSCKAENKCNICGKKFSRKSRLSRHKEKVHDIKPIKQLLYRVKALSLYYAAKEVVECTQEDLECEICSIKFPCWNAASQHKSYYHSPALSETGSDVTSSSKSPPSPLLDVNENCSIAKLGAANSSMIVYFHMLGLMPAELAVSDTTSLNGSDMSKSQANSGETGPNESPDGSLPVTHYPLSNTQLGGAPLFPLKCTCDICGKTVMTTKSLKRHKRKVHGVKFKQGSSRKAVTKSKKVASFTKTGAHKKIRKCDICNKVLLSGKVNRHKRLVHGVDPKALTKSKVQSKNTLCSMLQCDICGKKLAAKKNVKRHKMLIHGILPGATTQSSKSKSSHKSKEVARRPKGGATKRVATDGKRMPLSLKCQDCGKVFTGSYSLLKHRQAVHKTKITKSKHISSDLVCKYCGKIYSRSDTVKKHIKDFHSRKGKK